MLVIVQARTGSTRLPRKVFLPFVDRKSVLGFLLERINNTNLAVDIVIAAPLCDRGKFSSRREEEAVYAAEENDVLTRYYIAALKNRASQEDGIVRITSDCPLIDVYDAHIKMYDILYSNKLDYISNCHPKRYVPSGFDIEVFTFNALEEAYNKAKDPFDREHVTPYMWREMKAKSVKLPASNNIDISRKFSIDTKADYERIRFLAKKLFKEYEYAFTMSNVLEYAEKYALEMSAIEAQDAD